MVGRVVDEVLQHVVEEAHHVFDEGRVILPLDEALDVQRRQAAHRRAVIAEMVNARGQGDLGTQVRGLDRQARELLVLGDLAVHGVGIDDVGLAGLDPRRQQADPEAARLDRGDRRAVLGADQRPVFIGLDGAHEGIAHQHTMVQVLCLAVRVTTGRAPDLDELLDLGMVDRQIDRRRAAPQGALADRQRERIHHPDERDDARSLAVMADLLADGAKIAPIAADAAATRGEPDILVPQIDDALERIRGFVEETGDRQATLGAAVRENGRCRHEPEVGNVIVDALGML